MDPKKYKSKVDLWIATLLILIVALGLFWIIDSIFFSVSLNESIALGIRWHCNDLISTYIYTCKLYPARIAAFDQVWTISLQN